VIDVTIEPGSGVAVAGGFGATQADAGKALAIPDSFGIELDVKSLLDR
jgi:hypothetical protein